MYNFNHASTWLNLILHIRKMNRPQDNLDLRIVLTLKRNVCLKINIKGQNYFLDASIIDHFGKGLL